MNPENLEQAITAYLSWMNEQGYSRSTWSFYRRILKRYRKYVGDMGWESVFSMDTMAGFGRECKLVQFEPPIRGLARYLYKKGKIAKSMDTKEVVLPELYQQYLDSFQKTSQVCRLQVLNTRRVLVLFSRWVTREKIKLEKFEIEHADRFQAEVSNRYGMKTREHHRSVLRGLLRWLHNRIFRPGRRTVLFPLSFLPGRWTGFF